MGFYVFADNIVYFSKAGFLTHASFLSLLAVFSEGHYAMYQFWFVPVLLAFTALFVLMDKYLKKAYSGILIVALLFVFNGVNYSYMTSIRFEANIGFYLLVFTAGFAVAAKGWIEKLRTLKIRLLLLGIITIIVGYIDYSIIAFWNTNTVVGRLDYYVSAWLSSTIFILSLTALLLVLLFYLRQHFPKSKIFAVTGFLASCTLFIYLLEGYISPRVCRFVFDAQWYITDISGSLLLPSILLRILIVAIVAYGVQVAYNKGISKLAVLTNLPKNVKETDFSDYQKWED